MNKKFIAIGLIFLMLFVTNIAIAKIPTVSNILPSNESTLWDMTLNSLSCNISDLEGDTFNYEIQTSPDIGNSSANGETNGSKTCPISGMDYSTTYTWYVNTTNQGSNTNPIFVKVDMNEDGNKTNTVKWSNTKSQNGTWSIKFNSNSVSTNDYAMVMIETNFTLNVATTISYWSLTMPESGVTAPDEIFLEFDDYSFIACTSPYGIPDGVTWVQWTLAGSLFWYNPETLQAVNIADYYGKQVNYVQIGVGSPQSSSIVNAYVDNLTINGITFLDEPTGYVDIRCDNGDCTSLQDAIDGASPTDKILIHETYTFTTRDAKLRENENLNSVEKSLIGVVGVLIIVAFLYYVLSSKKKDIPFSKLVLTILIGIVLLTIIFSSL